ncbi:MAG: hypothetical protein EA384_10785 [Spirochaetaceae bacterium]|nr:MAG: hypothetical protein EA384_10785 [Spirochaetaceae bacterium]
MKQKHTVWALPAALCALGCLYLASLALFVLLPAQQRHGRIWSGFYMVLVDRHAACEPLVERLNGAGFDQVIAKCTATVSINSFGSQETLPLSRITARLDPVDPRIDPYVRALPAWFQTTLTGEPAAIMYLAGEQNPWFTYRRVAAALRDAGVWWRFPEWELRGAFVFAAAFALIAMMVTLRCRRCRTAVLAAALPWPAWVFFGGLPAFGVAVTVYIAAAVGMDALDSALRERRRGVLRLALLWLIAVTSVAFMTHPENGVHGRLPLLAGSAGVAAVVALWAVLRERRYRLVEHRLFTPLPITRLRGVRLTPVLGILPAVLLVAAAAPLAYVALPRHETPRIPEPEAVSGDYRSFDTLQRLFVYNGEGMPPNLSAYVTHRAFQEAFMYRRDWGMPQYGEVLARQRFARNGPILERTSEVIVEYTPDWLDRVLRESPPGGVEAILLAQPEPTRVVLRPKSRLYFDRSFLVRHAILMTVMAAPLLVYAAFRIRERFRNRGLMQRSYRQYA